MQTHAHPEIRLRDPRREISPLHNQTRVMKNAFVLSSLILTAGYPAVVVLSLLPIPSLFEFTAIYAALGVLAFALGDYSQRRPVTAPALNPPALQDAPVPFVPADPLRESTASHELKAA